MGLAVIDDAVLNWGILDVLGKRFDTCNIFARRGTTLGERLLTSAHKLRGPIVIPLIEEPKCSTEQVSRWWHESCSSLLAATMSTFRLIP